MQEMKPEFSAIVITRNEEANIGRCLKSLSKVTDDIVVVDSGSTDKTMEIAAGFTDKVISRPWSGFGQARNFAASKADHAWILALDADEELSPELILTLRTHRLQSHTVYALDRLNLFGSRWMKHGSWNPDWKLRLYPHPDVQWSHDAVHETLQVPEGWIISRLEGILKHYTAPQVRDFIDKMDRYARLAAEDLKKKGKRIDPVTGFLKGSFRFFSSFILKGGFLDGVAGYRLAAIEAWMVRKRYAYLRRMWREKEVEL